MNIKISENTKVKTTNYRTEDGTFYRITVFATKISEFEYETETLSINKSGSIADNFSRRVNAVTALDAINQQTRKAKNYIRDNF